MTIQIGKLKTKVHIQQESDTYDTDGSPIKTWNDFATPFVEFVSQTSKEFYKMQQRFNLAEAVLRTWYITGVTTKMRIQYGQRIFRIIGAVDESEQHRELLLACKEVVGNGDI